MFGAKVTDANGNELDIAVQILFGKDTIEVTIDEEPEVIEELKSNGGEYVYIQIFGPQSMFGQSKLVEFEVLLDHFRGNQCHRLNAVVGS